MAFGKHETESDGFGLDLSDLSFKFASFKQKHRSLKLEAFGAGDIPKGLIVDGEIHKEDEVAALLRRGLAKPERGRLFEHHVVCSLPEEHSFTRVIQLPRLQPEELKEAVRFEIEQNIPLKIDDVYYDWQTVETDKAVTHQDVLISAVPRRLADGYIAVLKKCGLVIKSLEVESVAVSRALVKDLKTIGPLLLVDIGATRTNFIIFSGATVQFSSSIPFAGNKMIDAIMKGLSVKPEEATALLHSAGLDKNAQEGKVYQTLEPMMRDLADQIRNYILFYEGHATHEHGAGPVSVKKILLAGGVANLVGLPVYLSLSLGISVEMGNPWANILKEPLHEVPGMSYRQSLGYTTALGLALSGLVTS